VELATPPPQADQNQLVITIKRDGVYLNSQKMKDVKELRDAIARQMLARPMDQRVVFINSEDALSFDRAVQAMDVAHQAGAAKVGFLTDPPKR
jgi:biopolymer transport protein ExbD